MTQHELDAQNTLDRAVHALFLAQAKLVREGPSIPLWDAVHFAEDKVANLKARQEEPK